MCVGTSDQPQGIILTCPQHVHPKVSPRDSSTFILRGMCIARGERVGNLSHHVYDNAYLIVFRKTAPLRRMNSDAMGLSYVPFAKCISGLEIRGGILKRDDFCGREYVNILRNWYAAAEGNRPAREPIRRNSRPWCSSPRLIRITQSKATRAIGLTDS
uniref:Uncharacterized protein n=1 Tax=Peronospora matthiolae TaxID=2874970 RepID=A0AAV1U0K2_9STRA